MTCCIVSAPAPPSGHTSAYAPNSPSAMVTATRTPPSAEAKKAGETLLSDVLTTAAGKEPMLVRAFLGNTKKPDDATTKFLRTVTFKARAPPPQWSARVRKRAHGCDPNQRCACLAVCHLAGMCDYDHPVH